MTDEAPAVKSRIAASFPAARHHGGARRSGLGCGRLVEGGHAWRIRRED